MRRDFCLPHTSRPRSGPAPPALPAPLMNKETSSRRSLDPLRLWFCSQTGQLAGSISGTSTALDAPVKTTREVAFTDDKLVPYDRGVRVRLNTDTPLMSRRSTVISAVCAEMFTSPKNCKPLNGERFD